LGVAIAFGTFVLVLANAFSHGISEVLFERIVRYTNGHVAISYVRNGNVMNQVFHDDARIFDAIKAVAPSHVRAEEAVGILGRAIGNGVADNVYLVGVDLGSMMTEKELKEFEANFKMLEGSFDRLKDSSVVGYPVVLAKQKADYLKLKMGDVMRIRITGVRNQASQRTAHRCRDFQNHPMCLWQCQFFSTSSMHVLLPDMVLMISLPLQVNMENPQLNAKKVANDIHARLNRSCGDAGERESKGMTTDMLTLGFRTDTASFIRTAKKYFARTWR
jgi:hypothetical protein